jgi:protein-tyrosine phosphatase
MARQVTGDDQTPGPGKRVLVTDAQSLAALGAVRSLGRAGHHVTAAWPAGTPPPPAARSRAVAETCAYPDPWSDPTAFRDWLTEAATTRRWDLMLPIGEAAVLTAALLRRRMPHAAVFALPPDKTLQYTLSRYQSTRLAQELGLPAPRTVYVSDGAGAQTWDQDFTALRFPIRIHVDPYWEADGSWRRGFTRMAQTAAQAIAYLRELTGLRTGIIAQESIEGGVYAVNYLVDHGRIVRRFAERRLHEIPGVEPGGSLSVSYRNQTLVELADRLTQGASMQGLIRVEFRLSPRDNRFRFVRLVGGLWDSLALALHCDVDFPADYVACLLDRPPLDGIAAPSTDGADDAEAADHAGDRPPYPVNRRCYDLLPGELNYLAAVFARRPDTAGAPLPSRPGALLRFLALCCNPVLRHDRFRWSDPMPGLIEARRVLARALRRLASAPARRVDRRREARLWADARREHRRRLQQPAYFSHPPAHILFVSHGDLCRGPIARRYWNRLLAERRMTGPGVDSAGFREPSGRRPSARILRLAVGYRLDLETHVSSLVTAERIDRADAILVMDGDDHRRLLRLFPQARDKTFFLGLFAGDDGVLIPNSAVTQPWDAEDSLRALVRAMDGLMERIVADLAAAR